MKPQLFLLLFLFINCASANPLIKQISLKEIPTENKNSLVFQFENRLGREIQADSGWLIEIPGKYKNRIPQYISVSYRKDQKYSPAENQWDNNNAYLELWFEIQKNQFYQWNDQFGARKRVASRPPHNPKKSTFYNLSEFSGNKPVSRILLCNFGEGNKKMAVANIHSLKIQFLETDHSFQKPVKVFSNPQKVNSETLSWRLSNSEGIPLLQKQMFIFELPDEWKNRFLLYAVLSHRKPLELDETDQNNIDPHPAYILFQAKNRKTGYWHNWVDSNGSEKYSEIRSAWNPEEEILHNCMKCLGKINIDKIALTNKGKGNPEKCISKIYQLDLVFRPPLEKFNTITRIYTPQTQFSNISKNEIVPLFGGGPRTNGKFENSLILGIRRDKRLQEINLLPSKYFFPVSENPLFSEKIDLRGRLHIPLVQGKTLKYLEIALGDLNITSKTYNKDGYFGESGKAECNVYLYNQKRNIKLPLIIRGNIGMACLLAAGGPEENYIIQKEDELLIEIINDCSYLMGYRISYR